MKRITSILISNFIFANIGIWIGYFINGSDIKLSLAVTLGTLSMTIISIISFKIKNLDVTTHNATK